MCLRPVSLLGGAGRFLRFHMSAAGSTLMRMSKQRAEGGDAIVAAIERQLREGHPLAETIHPGQVWRVHGHATRTLAWVRYLRPAEGTGPAYHVYRDTEGVRPWVRSFASLNSAVAWVVQHADELR